jgi:hypothetical protein
VNPVHFFTEIILESIGIQTVISGSELHPVPLIKFHADLMEYVNMAAMEDQEWQVAYNVAKDSNPIANAEYLPGCLSYKAWQWIPVKDDLHKMICEVEHDCKVAHHMGQDKTIEIIKVISFGQG